MDYKIRGLIHLHNLIGSAQYWTAFSNLSFSRRGYEKRIYSKISVNKKSVSQNNRVAAMNLEKKS